MPDASVTGSRIRGLAAAVPETVLDQSELAGRFGPEVAAKLAASSGVNFRRRIKPGQSMGDLCELAARRLLTELNWAPESVDAILVVSQSFDHIAPATSCLLQGKLGLSNAAAAFDISLGCSGWVYALWVASSLMKTGCKRVLVCTGEVTQCLSPFDNYGALSGECGTATALEADESATLHFSLGTDGKGWQSLWVPAGGSRLPKSAATAEYRDCEDGVRRSLNDMHMNGPDMFSFTIRVVPALMDRVLSMAGWSKADVDGFVFHQANKYMLDYLAKRMKLPADRIPMSIQDHGNTSSASMPLTIQQALRGRLQEGKMRLAMLGFGVGLSWGGVSGEIGPLVIPELQILP